MKAILLSGYRTSENLEQPLGLERDASGQRLLDRQIHQLSQLGYEVVCVLSGLHADEQLRLCPRIANTELVFDTNDHVSLATNTKAGLAATEGEGCFVLPVEIPAPPAAVWRLLKNEWLRLGFHVDLPMMQALDAQGAPWHFGFPLLITRNGNELIRGLNDFRSLADPRLTYHHLVYQPEADLAPSAKAA